MSDPPYSVAQTPERKKGISIGNGTKKSLISVGDSTSNSTEIDFTPYVINVTNGQDVIAKILSFSQQRQMDVFIMSTSGSVSKVTLQQFPPSVDTMIYEGHFDILSLSGFYLLCETGAPGNLRISICSDDGHVIGGIVGGKLIASGFVQVVVGPFMHCGNNSNKNIKEKACLTSGESPTIQHSETQPTSSSQTIPRPPYSHNEWRNSDRERQRLDDLPAYYQQDDS